MPTTPKLVEAHLGVSKNRGTPKWMVKIMENPIKMDDLGGKRTTIFGNIHFFSSALQTARQVAGNLSFYDLDLDLGDLGGEITWSVPQELGVFLLGKV